VNVTPDPEDIVQSEDDYAGRPIEVKICAPVQTRELPAAGFPGYFTAQALGTAVAVRLLALEPRRKSATIIPLDDDVWISGSQAGAQAGAGGAMRIPAATPYPITHMHEVWACAATATTDVSVETVNWSE
jgi:hypothetical protein